MPRKAVTNGRFGAMSVSEKMRHREVTINQPPAPRKSNNPWIKLVNETRSKYPNITLKEAMMRAKPIYAEMKANNNKE